MVLLFERGALCLIGTVSKICWRFYTGTLRRRSTRSHSIVGALSMAICQWDSRSTAWATGVSSLLWWKVLGERKKFSMSITINTPTPHCVLCCPRWAVLVRQYSFLSVSNSLLGLRFSVTRKSRSRYALQGDLTLIVWHCWRSGSTWGRTRCGATLWETSRHPLRKTNTTRAGDVWCSTMQRGTSTEILIGGRNLSSIVLWSPNCHSKTAAAICSRAAAAGWTSRTSTCLLPFSSMLSIRVTGPSSACSSKRRWKHCYSGMYSAVSSMPRGSGRMIQRATTTTGSLPLSKSLLRTLLKRVSVSRRKVASFLAGMRYQPGHLTEFCRKCSLCFRSIAVSYSSNPACSIKEVARDSCSSTRLGTHRYSGDDSESGCGTQANTYSDRTRSQGASSDPGEGSLARRPFTRFLQRSASTRCCVLV